MGKVGDGNGQISLILHTNQWGTPTMYQTNEGDSSRGFVKGIRQGDSLSPYLFLLRLEGLNGLIKKAIAVGDLRGFSLCKSSPQISHLFFANESLIFC